MKTQIFKNRWKEYSLRFSFPSLLKGVRILRAAQDDTIFSLLSVLLGSWYPFYQCGWFLLRAYVHEVVLDILKNTKSDFVTWKERNAALHWPLHLSLPAVSISRQVQRGLFSLLVFSYLKHTCVEYNTNSNPQHTLWYWSWYLCLVDFQKASK